MRKRKAPKVKFVPPSRRSDSKINLTVGKSTKEYLSGASEASGVSITQIIRDLVAMGLEDWLEKRSIGHVRGENGHEFFSL